MQTSVASLASSIREMALTVAAYFSASLIAASLEPPPTTALLILQSNLKTFNEITFSNILYHSMFEIAVIALRVKIFRAESVLNWVLRWSQARTLRDLAKHFTALTQLHCLFWAGGCCLFVFALCASRIKIFAGRL